MKRILSLCLSFLSLLLIPFLLQAQSAAPQKQLLIQLNPQMVTSEEQGRAALKEIIGLAHANTSDIQNPSQSPYIGFIKYYDVSLTNRDDNPEEILASIKRADSNHLIINAEVNAQIQAHLSPNDPSLSSQWALGTTAINIGAQQAWDINHSARNVPIAIIDSGIDRSNSDEVGANLSSYYDFISNSESAVDGYTHGTKVFGIIGASSNNQHGISGLVWEAQIMSLRVLDNDGHADINLTLLAIGHAIQHHARIINLSWGYKSNNPSSALEQALRQARNAGILVVCSAGNNIEGGEDNDLESRNYPSSYNLDNIIAVAASDNHDLLASFSNYGAHTVHLAAPGSGIYSLSRGSYSTDNGTSFAAPYVTATAALIWGLKPDLSYQQVKQLILSNVDVVTAFQGKTTTGGRLNVFKSLQAAQGTTAVPISNPGSTTSTTGSSNTTGDGQNISPGGVDIAPSPAPTPPDPPAASSGGSSGGCSLETTETHPNTFHLLLSVVLFIFAQALMRRGFFDRSLLFARGETRQSRDRP